jgi:hypothetical protein
MTEYRRALDRTSQGKTTGPGSRIFSWIFLNLYVITAAYLIDNRLYLVVIIAVILAITPIAPLGIIGMSIYLFYARLWTGFTLTLLLVISGFLSVRLGVRYNARRIRTRGAFVDPFENIQEIAPATIVQLGFLALALLFDGFIAAVFFLISGLAALIIFWRYAFRLRANWARLHYPLLIRYSMYAGEEAARAMIHGREQSIHNTIPPFLRSVYPDRTEQELAEISASAEQKLVDFSDELPIGDYFKAQGIDPHKIDRYLEERRLEVQQGKGWNSKFLRYIIAEIITMEFGHAERIKYIAALLTGEAA